MRKRIELLCQNCRRRYKCFSPCKKWNKQAQKEMGIKMKGFTIIELVIVLALVAIVAAVLIPSFINFFESEKDNIVDIANGDVETVNVDIDGNVLESTEGYVLVNVSFEKGVVYCVYELESQD